jgi:hypothetical protein
MVVSLRNRLSQRICKGIDTKEGVEVLKALWNQHQEDNDASPSTYSSIRYDGKFFRINGASPFQSDIGARFTKTKIPVHSE